LKTIGLSSVKSNILVNKQYMAFVFSQIIIHYIFFDLRNDECDILKTQVWSSHTMSIQTGSQIQRP